MLASNAGNGFAEIASTGLKPPRLSTTAWNVQEDQRHAVARDNSIFGHLQYRDPPQETHQAT